MEKEITLYKPNIEELYYRQRLVEDEKTMEFNDGNGGCFPFDRSKWRMFYQKWILDEHYFYRYIQNEKYQFVGEANYVETYEANTCLVHILIQYDERNKTYGSKALTVLFDHARKNGMKKVYAMSNDISFLENKGFQKENNENCKYYKYL